MDHAVEIVGELHAAFGACQTALITAPTVAGIAAGLEALAVLQGTLDALADVETELARRTSRDAVLGDRIARFGKKGRGKEPNAGRITGTRVLVAALDEAVAPWLGDVANAAAALWIAIAAHPARVPHLVTAGHPTEQHESQSPERASARQAPGKGPLRSVPDELLLVLPSRTRTHTSACRESCGGRFFFTGNEDLRPTRHRLEGQEEHGPRLYRISCSPAREPAPTCTH